jgi:hypothetical protein
VRGAVDFPEPVAVGPASCGDTLLISGLVAARHAVRALVAHPDEVAVRVEREPAIGVRVVTIRATTARSLLALWGGEETPR